MSPVFSTQAKKGDIGGKLGKIKKSKNKIEINFIIMTNILSLFFII
jgi:hypothetical protein